MDTEPEAGNADPASSLPGPTGAESPPPPAKSPKRHAAATKGRPIEDALRAIEFCRQDTDRRAIRGILRVAQHAVMTREEYASDYAAFRFRPARDLIFLADLGAFFWPNHLGRIFGAIGFGAVLLGVVVIRKAAVRSARKRGDIPRILAATVEAIQDLIDRQNVPSRFEAEDWRNLGFLEARDPRFGPIRAVLASTFGEEPKTGDGSG